MYLLKKNNFLFRIISLSIVTILLSGCLTLNENRIQREKIKKYFTDVYTLPQQVAVEDIAKISAGGLYTVALKEDGTVWAWGYNSVGQLGIGTRVSQTSPQQLTLVDNITDIATGVHHTLALKKDGTVWAWGYNDRGQLGLGHRRFETIPEQVFGLNNVISIAAGNKTSYAIQEDGSVWSWGNNSKGQLGLGPDETRDQGRPKLIKELNGKNIKRVVAGQQFALALDADGNVWAWGDGAGGMLGLGKVDFVDLPTRIEFIDNIRFLTTKFRHAFAIKADKTVWGWGRNFEGQIGIDFYLPILDTPQEMVEKPVDFVYLATGYTSSFAIDENGELWGWGLNNNRQLGYFGDEKTNVPRKISYVEDVRAISLGFTHVVVLKADKTVWTWGYDHEGLVIGKKRQRLEEFEKEFEKFTLSDDEE